MSLPDLAIRRPVFIVVVFLIVALMGGISFLNLPVDLMPDVSFPTISVTTTYQGVGSAGDRRADHHSPGAGPLASTPGIKEMTSRSSEGDQPRAGLVRVGSGPGCRRRRTPRPDRPHTRDSCPRMRIRRPCTSTT